MYRAASLAGWLTAALSGVLLWPAPATAQFALSVDPLPVQESADTAYVTARWFYTYPDHWTVRYLYEVEGIVAGETTGDSIRMAIPKLANDQSLQFCLTMDRVSPEPVLGPQHCEPFVVPARPLYALLTASYDVAGVDSIPHDPRFEVQEGTLWLEFTPNTLTGVQGIWSKDYNGYQTGGHLSITLHNDSIRFRLQDTVTSYQYQFPGVVAGALNQAAVEFGPDGFRGWLNGIELFVDPYTGGTEGNQNAIVIGANSQGTDPWTNPLDGVVNAAEFYSGKYDFSSRWGEPPVPPEPPVPLPDSVTIRVGMVRIWTDPATAARWLQYWTAPATYRYVDHRIGQDTTYHYEVWVEGQKVGYTMDASYGVVECWKAEQGEVCPVRPWTEADENRYFCSDAVTHASNVEFPLCDYYGKGPGRFWMAEILEPGPLTVELRLYRSPGHVLVGLRRDTWNV